MPVRSRAFTPSRYQHGQRWMYASSGGTIVEQDGWRAHIFNDSANLVVTQGGLAWVLLVGGGGAGGFLNGGGGGGGGYIEGRIIVPAGTHAAVVGGGGAGIPNAGPDAVSANGSPSSLGSLLTAIGGGGGATAMSVNGNTGGSGGGGGTLATLGIGGGGTNHQGLQGGTVSSTLQENPAGAGGSAGMNEPLLKSPHYGGWGIVSDITFTGVSRGGGGGGRSSGCARNKCTTGGCSVPMDGTPGISRSGEGGTGACETRLKAIPFDGVNAATSGLANRGGGGGGGGNLCCGSLAGSGIRCGTNVWAGGGSGGSGIIVVRYRLVA